MIVHRIHTMFWVSRLRYKRNKLKTAGPKLFQINETAIYLNIVISIDSGCASSETGNERVMKLLISSTSLPPFYVFLLHSQLPKFRLPYNWVSNHCSTANCCQCSASSAYNCTFQCHNVKFFEVWNVKCSR